MPQSMAQNGHHKPAAGGGNVRSPNFARADGHLVQDAYQLYTPDIYGVRVKLCRTECTCVSHVNKLHHPCVCAFRIGAGMPPRPFIYIYIYRP